MPKTKAPLNTKLLIILILAINFSSQLISLNLVECLCS